MSADLPTATILPPSTTIAASRMTRRLASMVISQAMSAMTRSTDCTGAPYSFSLPDFGRARVGLLHLAPCRRTDPTPTLPGVGEGAELLILPDVGQLVGDLQL